jgi:hypothetical protein
MMNVCFMKYLSIKRSHNLMLSNMYIHYGGGVPFGTILYIAGSLKYVRKYR